MVCAGTRSLEQVREALLRGGAERDQGNDPAAGFAYRRDDPGAFRLCAAVPWRYEDGSPGECRRETGEELLRDALPDLRDVAGGQECAPRIQHSRRSHADRAGGLDESRDDALGLAPAGRAGGKAGDGRAQLRIGGQLPGLVAPLGDPALDRLDLGVEQALQAGRAGLAQRLTDAAIGPQADAEHGCKQHE